MLFYVLDSNNQLMSSRQDIVDVFADFYANLYESKVGGSCQDNIFRSTSEIPKIYASPSRAWMER